MCVYVCVLRIGAETFTVQDAQLSMLQMSAQTSLSADRAIPDAQGRGRRRRRSLLALKRYSMLKYRKAGWEMTSAAFESMKQAELRMMLSDVAVPMSIELRGDKSLDELDLSRCYGQFVRNPFEMVVSGYLYDMASAEPFTLKKFGTVKDRCMDLIPGTDEWDYKHCREMSSVFQVFSGSRSGPLSALLLDAKLDESFSEYLRRVDVNTGLLAEYIFAQSNTLNVMRDSNSFLDSFPHCSMRLCFNDFYDDCNHTWQRLFQTWAFPEPQKSAMLLAAAKSCPETDSNAHDHDSSELVSQLNISHPPESEMVRRLRKLDLLHLNGALHALEEHLGCPVSGRYKKHD